MDSCNAHIGAHQYCVAKIYNASQRVNAHKLQNDPFTISSSVLWTHLRPEIRVATSRVSECKNAHFFLLDIAESDHLWFLHHSSTSLMFSTDWCQSTPSSYLYLGWLADFHFSSMTTWVTPSSVERVWWTGFLEGNRWPIKPIPQAFLTPLTEMRAKCGFERHK